MSLNHKRLGQRIKSFRQQRHLSQERLAESSGISSGFISHIELGLKAPGLDTIIEIASALGVTPNDLLLDSIPTSTVLEISELLLECSPEERAIITENAKSLVTILRIYKIR